jgi:hypothetical protein
LLAQAVLAPQMSVIDASTATKPNLADFLNAFLLPQSIPAEVRTLASGGVSGAPRASFFGQEASPPVVSTSTGQSGQCSVVTSLPWK